MIISMSVDKDINWFFLVILLIKESCYMTGLETKLTKPNHQPKVVVSAATFPWLTPCKKKLDWVKGTPGNIQPKVLPSLDDYLLAKNWDINWPFPEILMIKESCNLIGQKAYPETVVSGVTLNWWLLPCEKDKILFDSFQRNCWSKNPAI